MSAWNTVVDVLDGKKLPVIGSLSVENSDEMNLMVALVHSSGNKFMGFRFLGLMMQGLVARSVQRR